MPGDENDYSSNQKVEEAPPFLATSAAAAAAATAPPRASSHFLSSSSTCKIGKCAKVVILFLLIPFFILAPALAPTFGAIGGNYHNSCDSMSTSFRNISCSVTTAGGGVGGEILDTAKRSSSLSPSSLSPSSRLQPKAKDTKREEQTGGVQQHQEEHGISTTGTITTKNSNTKEDEKRSPIMDETKKGQQSNNISSEITPKKITLNSNTQAVRGTFHERTQRYWNLFFSQCHPRPCPQKWRRESFRRDTKIFLTIRDPIDRYVSAFYWRYKILCNPFEEEQENNKTEATSKSCFKRKGTKLEKDTLFKTYKEEASALAEDLCSSNETIAEDAGKRLHSIGHARLFLRHFIDFNWRSENMFGIVLEDPGKHDYNTTTVVDLDAQIDQGMEWLQEQLPLESPQQFARRVKRAKAIKREDQYLRQHSSRDVKRALTPEAVQCLKKQHQKDYELLRDKKDNFCKVEACKVGIDSILKRRQILFEDRS